MTSLVSRQADGDVRRLDSSPRQPFQLFAAPRPPRCRRPNRREAAYEGRHTQHQPVLPPFLDEVAITRIAPEELVCSLAAEQDPDAELMRTPGQEEVRDAD